MSIEFHNIGDIKYKNWEKYVWSPCEICGKQRWVKIHQLEKGKEKRCIKCGNIKLVPLLPKDYIPSEGEIRLGKELNKKPGNSRFIWVSCSDCGKYRWVCYINKKPISTRCSKCNKPINAKGERNYFWNGGKTIDSSGYVNIKIWRDNPYYSMAKKIGYVLEHRLVMAQHLGRCLLKSEIVHHRNGIKSDNRIENLELVSHLVNLSYDKMCHDCELKKEIRLLRWQIKELSQQLQVKLNMENIC